MESTSWFVRPAHELFDPYDVYGTDPNYFTLKVFHGGVFINSPSTLYVDGKISHVDMIDSDAFSVHEVNAMIQELGYPKEQIMYYHYRVPDMDLRYGLRQLGTDQVVLCMLKLVPNHKIIELYVEHWVSRLNAFVPSPSNVVISEMDAPVQSKRKKLQPLRSSKACKKLPLIEWTVQNEQNDEGTVNQQNDEGTVNQQNDEGTVNQQNDAPGQDNTNEQNEADVQHDYEPLVDEDNMVEEVDVNMDSFKDNIQSEFKDNEENLDEDGDDVDVDGDSEYNDGVVDLEDFESGTDEEDMLETAVRKLRKRKKKAKVHDPAPFYVGQSFKSKADLKVVVKSYALTSRRQLFIFRNEKLRFRVECKGKNPIFVGGQTSKTTEDESCPWILHVSRKKAEDAWVVKTFKDDHRCLQTRKVNLYTVSAVAQEIEPIVETNPEIPTKVLLDLIQKKHQVEIGFQKMFRAKVMATQKVHGDFTAQYLLLWDYAEELKRTNPGTTVLIDVQTECNPDGETRQFKRIYICYEGLKAGFKQLGRELLGLDGCFMKGPFPGQILTAVGVDGNTGIYPVAFAVVESETTDSWKWFLTCLGDDLNLSRNSNFTFISDRQKGIIPAIKYVFSSAEHRYCLRHIHENMRIKWKGDPLKEMIWKAARCSTVQRFDKKMEDIKKEDASLHKWLLEIPPQHWARSHFSGRAKCDVLLNNLCEVLNRQLIGARDKPIITCLEFIREYLMKRIGIVNKTIAKSQGPLTPTATKTFKFIKEQASQLNVLWNGHKKYQVNGPWGDQYVVDVDSMTCACRKWELTGMPCQHAVAVNWNMATNAIEVGVPESWVDEAYWLDTWRKVYQHTINPINGKDMWNPSKCPTSLLPPKHHIQIGRPTKARRKSAEELSQHVSVGGKMTKKGRPVTCQICKQKGHNKRGCKEKGPPTSTQ